MFCDVFSFPPGVYAGNLNLIASIPDFFLTLNSILRKVFYRFVGFTINTLKQEFDGTRAYSGDRY